MFLIELAKYIPLLVRNVHDIRKPEVALGVKSNTTSKTKTMVPYSLYVLSTHPFSLPSYLLIVLQK